jgi:hypothetical protein
MIINHPLADTSHASRVHGENYKMTVRIALKLQVVWSDGKVHKDTKWKNVKMQH